MTPTDGYVPIDPPTKDEQIRLLQRQIEALQWEIVERQKQISVLRDKVGELAERKV